MKKRSVDAKSDKILVLLDREQGAQKMAEDNGLRLYALIPFKTKGIKWLKDKFSQKEFEVITDYLENTEKYQDTILQEKLKSLSLN